MAVCYRVLEGLFLMATAFFQSVSSAFAARLFFRLKADKELVKEVYSAAKRLKMERVKQVSKPSEKTVFLWFCRAAFNSHSCLKTL